MYNETRAVAKETDIQQDIRYLGLHQPVSGLCARERLRIRRLVLCCGVLLAFSGDEADGEMARGGHSDGKPRPQPREAFDSVL